MPIGSNERIPELVPLYAAIDIRSEIARLQSGYRINLWSCIAKAYDVALAISSNDEAYTAFVEEDFWQSRKKRPKAHDKSRILLHVMVFVFNAITANAYSRAWKYAKALEAYFADGVPSDQIRDLIEEEGGIEAMLKKLAKKGRADDDEVRAALNPDADGLDIDIPDFVEDEDQENSEAEDQEEDDDRVRSSKIKRSNIEKPKKSRAQTSGPKKALVKSASGEPATAASEDAKRALADRFRLLVQDKYSREFKLLKLGETATIRIKMVQFRDTVRPEMMSLKRTER